jgi:hypothetical protein
MANQDFTMYRGETGYVNFTVLDTNGTAVNLTNYTVHWGLALNSLGDYLLHKHSPTASGITIVAAASGMFRVILEPDDTSDLRADKYYHEARLVDASGNQSVVAIGFATILPSITA